MRGTADAASSSRVGCFGSCGRRWMAADVPRMVAKTVWPRSASATAVSYPKPLLVPVTRTLDMT
jgi:hypothetical protein